MDEPALTASNAATDRQLASDADQSLADADQTMSDSDQTLSDSDQAGSDSDQAGSTADQRASDRDQDAADRDLAEQDHPTPASEAAHEKSEDERDSATEDRRANRSNRSTTSRERDSVADERDEVAAGRETSARVRDAHPDGLKTESEMLLLHELRGLRSAAAADRARAAADRARAAQDRADAARERARLENELRSAHLDGLTGAMRREAGRLALEHEINRARRTDGRFVLAFVDIDRLKEVNDRQGHAAGDRVLQAVVQEIASSFRSFDPIVRYGGDEFVCGISGIDREEAERRFVSIGDALQAAVGVKFSLGLAELAEGDTVDTLTERADGAMLEVKATHHSRASASAS